MEQTRVLLGMSGGVDSSAAAVLLQRQGHQVVGCTLRLHEDAAPEGVERAAAVAEKLEQVSGCEMPRQLRELKEKQVRFTDVFSRENMLDALKKALND